VLTAFVLALPTAMGFAAPADASLRRDLAQQSTFAETGRGIHLGLAFDYNAASALASNIDYVFGGHFLDWDFRLAPSTAHGDGYIPFDTDPFPQTFPGHSLSWWQANHPDWIVYRCDGKTPAYYGSGNTDVPLDFSNPSVRDWQVTQAMTLLARGAPGVAFDDFTFANFENRCGVYRNRVWTPLGYPGAWEDNAKYTADMVEWLRNVRAQLKARFPDRTLTVNLAPSVSGLANLKLVTPYIDMDFDEAGFTDYGDHNLSGEAWRREVSALEYLNSRGKAFDVNGIVNAAGDGSVGRAQINWVLANYLLVKGGHSYTYVYAGNSGGFTGSPSGYGAFADRPEYHLPIGTPTSGRHESQGVQMRDYSNGLVIVNPSPSTYTVKLPSALLDAYGESHDSVSLGPATGVVLLRSDRLLAPSIRSRHGHGFGRKRVKLCGRGPGHQPRRSGRAGSRPAATSHRAGRHRTVSRHKHRKRRRRKRGVDACGPVARRRLR
jgi:hypothetical protein